jgi:hypothetical protein
MRDIETIRPDEAGHVGSLYGSPYYLLCEGRPLPIAIREGRPVALAWRDEWASIATDDAKEYCGFDGTNWVSGFNFMRR